MKIRLRNNVTAITLFAIVILAVLVPIAMQNSYKEKAVYGDSEPKVWDSEYTLALNSEVPFDTHYVARGLTFSYLKISANAPVDIYLRNSTGIVAYRNTTFVEVNVTKLENSYSALYMYEGNETVLVTVYSAYDAAYPSFEGYSYIIDGEKFWSQMLFAITAIVGMIAGNLLRTLISTDEEEEL